MKFFTHISQENVCVGVFSCKFCDISKMTFFYRTPPVAASGERSRKEVKRLLVSQFCAERFERKLANPCSLRKNSVNFS